MSPYFFTYIESIPVVIQTHQISAFNSSSYRHFLNQKTQILCTPLLSLQLAKGVAYRIVMSVMTSMTLRSLFLNSVFARFLRHFRLFEILHCINSGGSRVSQNKL